MIFDFLAQSLTSAPSTLPAEVPWYARILRDYGMIVPLAFFLPIFYFFVIRNKRKQDKEKADTMGSIKKGDNIETIGGILGTVVSIDENTVVLKIDETANTKMRFNRRAIHRVIADTDKT